MTLDSICAEVVLGLPWLLNGSLPPESRRTIREHLIACPKCRQEMARTREVMALFAAAGVAPEVAPETRTVRPLAAFPARNEVRGLFSRGSAWATAAAVVIAVLGGLLLGHPGRNSSGASARQEASKIKVVSGGAQPLFCDDFDNGQLSGWKQQR